MAKYAVDGFAQRLRDLRRIKGLKQEEISKMLNVHRTSYTKYETDRATPPQILLREMAEYFNVSADYLLALSDRTGRDTDSGMTAAELSLIAAYRHMDAEGRAQMHALAEELTRLR